MKPGSNWSTGEYKMKTSSNEFLEVNIFDRCFILTSRQPKKNELELHEIDMIRCFTPNTFNELKQLL